MVGSLAVGLGVAASVGGTSGALLGSTTGAVGATISSKKLLSSNQ
ncbi:hypothetical protein [Chroogloeocystis siderophila]|jgi:hypothetical protein|nr:hypothetical protein [Chroogloeocystis siderophila]